MSDTFEPGNAGSVSVNVAGALAIDGTGANFVTGILAIPAQGGTGNAGEVTVTAGSLAIVDGGEISAAALGLGNADGVSINVTGQLAITGTSGFVWTGVSSDSFPDGTGYGGSVSVSVGTLSIVNNGMISSDTFGPGDAGRVSVNVAEQLRIDGTSADTNFATGILAAADPGSAGSVSVSAESLTILGNA